MKKEVLYKRNAKGEPLIWSIEEDESNITVRFGLFRPTSTLHSEKINKTLVKTDEFTSRVKAKVKEGYKRLSELKDSTLDDITDVYSYVSKYLPKNNTTGDGFILPMLCKTLEDNKPFDKNGFYFGQFKINGLRCLVGAYQDLSDMFNPIKLTYTSREGTTWNLKWFDDILLPLIDKPLLDMLLEEGAKLDGELYLPGYSVNDINSFVKNNTLPQHYKLQYWCYDIAVENMSAEARNEYRLNHINIDTIKGGKDTHLNNKQQVVILPSVGVDNIRDALAARDKFITYGYEGLVIRQANADYGFGKRNQTMMKFKKVDDGLFTIVDVVPQKKHFELAQFVCINDINDELFEVVMNVDNHTNENYLHIREHLIGKQINVEFRERSGVKQVPFHARGIEIII